MTKSLQTLNETTERLWLEIEDQVARPFVWTAAAVKANHAAAVSADSARPAAESAEDELKDEPRNPLRRWRWA